MIIEEIKDKLETNVSSKHSFGITLTRNSFDLLAKSLYQNIHSSVLMELLQNGIDAQIRVGRGHIPIKITLPTITNPVLIIEDCGCGMGEEFIFGKYLMIFESSKRDSNEQNGAWGVGRLTALGFTGSYNILSKCDGKQNLYSVFFGEAGIPEIALISSEDINVEDPYTTGVTISVNVNPEDANRIQLAAEEAFYYVPVLPEFVNAEVNIKHITKESFDYEDDHVLIKFDPGYNNRKCVVHNGLYGYKAIIKTDILNDSFVIIKSTLGEVTPTASRDALTMDEKTKNFLDGKLSIIHSNFLIGLQAKLDSCDTLIDANKIAHTYRYKHFYNTLTYKGYGLEKLKSGEFYLTDDAQAQSYEKYYSIYSLGTNNRNPNIPKVKISYNTIGIVYDGECINEEHNIDPLRAVYFLNDVEEKGFKNRIKNYLMSNPDKQMVIVSKRTVPQDGKLFPNPLYTLVKFEDFCKHELMSMSVLSDKPIILNKKPKVASPVKLQSGEYILLGKSDCRYDETITMGFSFNTKNKSRYDVDVTTLADTYYLPTISGKVQYESKLSNKSLYQILNAANVLSKKEIKVILIPARKQNIIKDCANVLHFSKLEDSLINDLAALEDKYKFVANYRESYLYEAARQYMTEKFASHPIISEIKGVSKFDDQYHVATSFGCKPSDKYMNKLKKFNHFIHNDVSYSGNVNTHTVELLNKLSSE